MKTIPLSKGQVAMVDDLDYEFFNQFKWHALKSKYTYYAVRSIYLPGRKYKKICMHHHLFPNCSPYQVDHIDCDGLNNQRSNLRLCTPSQNRINQTKKVGSSRFKGVSWCTRDNRWTVRLKKNGEQNNLGNFKDEVEAAKTYDKFAIQYFGEYAKLNFPEIISPSTSSI